MIALLATYLLIFYILIPGVLFRFPASWFLKLKLFQLNRTQEATFAALVAILAFAAALGLVWYVPAAAGPAWTAAERAEDYQREATLALASDVSNSLQEVASRLTQRTGARWKHWPPIKGDFSAGFTCSRDAKA